MRSHSRIAFTATRVHDLGMRHSSLMAFVISLLFEGLAFLIVARLLPRFRLRGGFGSAVLVAFVYGIVKALLFNVLVFLSLPLVLVTFGLFILVINAFILWLTDKLMRRLEVEGFGTLVLGAFLLSVLDWIFRWVMARAAV